LPAGKYSLCGGVLTDSQGRGCILTPPTFVSTNPILYGHLLIVFSRTQFQCDAGAKPTYGFSISSSGQILYNGSGTFYACPTGDNGAYNIYTKSIQAKCVVVTLTANGCAAPPAPPKPAAPSCGYALNNFEFPHLLVPVNSASPNQAYGTQYFGQVTSTISSIYNFDIPPKDAGKTCSLVFLFPQQKDLQTSSFTFSGAGNIDFAKLSNVANQQTTYANQPSVATDYGVTKVAPGNQYTIASFPCPANTAISFKLSSKDTSLKYFQDYNPSP